MKKIKCFLFFYLERGQMENYKPNSNRSKNNHGQAELPEKKVEKIISGSAKSKKPNEIQKIAGVFMSEDIENVKSYILMDVLVPAIKKAISDIVTNGIDMALYGEDAGSRRKKSSASKVSYGGYYERDRENRSTRGSTIRTRTNYNYEDIVLDNRGDAEEVLLRMDELISTYGMVSVADFYDLVGITGNYTDNKYGWSDIRSATVVRVRDGYVIKMPRATVL